MTSIITPGQARAEVLGVPQGPDPVVGLVRATHLGRVQGTLDAMTSTVAVCAAILLGHKIDLAAFGMPIEETPGMDVGQRAWVAQQNSSDDSYVRQSTRRLHGAVAVARGLLTMASQAVGPVPQDEAPSEPIPETGDVASSQRIDEAPAETNEVSA